MEGGRFDWYARSRVRVAPPPVEASGCSGVAVLVNRGNAHGGVGDVGLGTVIWVRLSDWQIAAVGDCRRDCLAVAFSRLRRRFSSSIADWSSVYETL
jgi:hypothetical protein